MRFDKNPLEPENKHRLSHFISLGLLGVIILFLLLALLGFNFASGQWWAAFILCFILFKIVEHNRNDRA